jgi:CelD/BcsL family acetyltransferase involved in cellulose biosynthesis
MSDACFSPEAPAAGRRRGAGKGRQAGAGSVTVLGAQELSALVPHWEDLARNALEPNPFYEHWMLRPALESLGAGLDVRIAAIWCRGELCGLMPLERVARVRGLPVSALRAWRYRHTLLCTPLIRAGRAAQCLAALLDWLRSAEGAPLLELDFIPSEGPLDGALRDWMKDAKLRSLSDNAHERPLLRKASDAQTYLADLPSRQTRELRRRERRLAERGAVAHVALGPDGDLERWMEDFLQLEAAGWKGEKGSAFASTEQGRCFALSILREAFARGRLHMAGIDLDGKPLARCVSFLGGAGSFAFKTAYDEKFAAFSPGVIAEIDRIGALHALPAVRWMDSMTSPDNEVLGRLWKERLGIHRLLVATRPAGSAVVAALPMLGTLRRAARSTVARSLRPVAAVVPATVPHERSSRP